MNTEQWIHMLSTGAGPAPRRVVPTRVGLALVGGTALSTTACALALGLNPALFAMGTALVVKLLYVLSVLGVSAWWLGRASRPAARWHGAAGALLGIVAIMGAWTSLALSDAPAGSRVSLLVGHSSTSCPWLITVLALPPLGMALWALRGLAPTRPRLAGFVAGLFGGGTGALAYSLFCTEVSPAFVLIWYSLGMLAPAAAGAWIGPRLLRW